MLDHLYVAGVTDADTNVFLKMDLLAVELKWEQLDAWPGEVILKPAAAGLHGKFYLFGKDPGQTAASEINVYEFSASGGWRKLSSPPGDFSSVLAGPCGDAHILLFSDAADGKEILAYHTITSQWVKIGVLPEAVSPLALTAKGTKFSLIGDKKVLGGEAILTPTKYSWMDHGLVVVFMVGMLYIGTFLSKRQKSSKDYFRGGNRIPWWAAGLSMFATGASAVSLMAMPGKSFAEDWVWYTVSIYCVVIALPIMLFVNLKLARRLDVATSNEYLERRYNLFLRLCGGVIWSLLQIVGRMATIMLLPAFAISSVCGIPVEVSILIMGVVTTFYVYLGGLASVIWTDVIQGFIMIGTVMICATWAFLSLSTDAAGAMEILSAGDKLHMWKWQINWFEPCVFVMALSLFFGSLGGICDQNFIQRIQCVKSEKESMKATITQMSVAVPLNAVLFAMGTVLFLYYYERPEMLSPSVKADAVFPLFAAQNLPAGLAGLVIVAILSATMSTLSSSINSTVNIGVEDFYRRLSKNATDHKCVILGRILTACFGVFGTSVCLVLANTELKSVWDLNAAIFGSLFGVMAGIFALGTYTRRGNTAGAIVGAIASGIVVYYVKNHTHLSFFLYPVFGILTCVGVGYIASMIIPAKKKDLRGLTIYTLLKRKD
jgi:SSS family transporter